MAVISLPFYFHTTNTVHLYIYFKITYTSKFKIVSTSKISSTLHANTIKYFTALVCC